MSEIMYFSKEFVNNLRKQLGVPPWEGTQEELDRNTRRIVADAEVERARDLVVLAERNYDEVVARAKEAWKQ